MKKLSALLIILLSAGLISSCNNKSNDPGQVTVQEEIKDSAAALEEYAHDHMEDKDSSAENDSEIETLYLVIADTGRNYFELLDNMLALKSEFGMTIDSMDRYYDRKKNKIILPANHEDELYAGQYFPRRFPSTCLSVEYLETYKPGSDKNTMAVVAGIFEKEKSADSSLNAIRKTDKDAFKLKAEIFLGCAH